MDKTLKDIEEEFQKLLEKQKELIDEREKLLKKLN